MNFKDILNNWEFLNNEDENQKNWKEVSSKT